LLRRVETLEAELAATRGRRETSMAAAARCPACGARKILQRATCSTAPKRAQPHGPRAAEHLARQGRGEFEILRVHGLRLCEWRVKDLVGLEIDNERSACSRSRSQERPYR